MNNQVIWGYSTPKITKPRQNFVNLSAYFKIAVENWKIKKIAQKLFGCLIWGIKNGISWDDFWILILVKKWNCLLDILLSLSISLSLCLFLHPTLSLALLIYISVSIQVSLYRVPYTVCASLASIAVHNAIAKFGTSVQLIQEESWKRKMEFVSPELWWPEYWYYHRP